jgi:hypothetical protein
MQTHREHIDLTSLHLFLQKKENKRITEIFIWLRYGIRAERSRNRDSILARANRFISFSQRPDRFRGPATFVTGIRDQFSGLFPATNQWLHSQNCLKLCTDKGMSYSYSQLSLWASIRRLHSTNHVYNPLTPQLRSRHQVRSLVATATKRPEPDTINSSTASVEDKNGGAIPPPLFKPSCHRALLIKRKKQSCFTFTYIKT